MAKSKSTPPLQERFESKIFPCPMTGCWLWTGLLNGAGQYGTIKSDGSHKAAHRLAWELYKGPIPEKLCVLHHCDVPCCVSPTHLFLGTYSDNEKDKLKKGRGNKLRGAQISTSKLTPDAIHEIRASTLPQRALARKFSVSQAAILHVTQRKTWKHI